MHTLGNTKHIVRLVLAWFLLFQGFMVMSTACKLSSLHMVCSVGSNIKWVDNEGNESQLTSTSVADCLLCASALLSTSDTQFAFEQPSALAHALQPFVAARIVAATAPPLPSRGPPSFVL